jgi:hypothetical protein
MTGNDNDVILALARFRAQKGMQADSVHIALGSTAHGASGASQDALNEVTGSSD